MAAAVVVVAGLLLGAAPSQAADPFAGWKELLPRHAQKPIIIHGHSEWPGAPVVTGPNKPKTGLWSDDFQFRSAHSGYSQIENRWSGLCLGIRGAAIPGAFIEQQPCNTGGAHVNTLWYIDVNQPFYAWTFRSKKNWELVMEVPHRSEEAGMPLSLGTYWGGQNQQFFRIDNR